jgi:hypothetical protein
MYFICLIHGPKMFWFRGIVIIIIVLVLVLVAMATLIPKPAPSQCLQMQIWLPAISSINPIINEINWVTS